MTATGGREHRVSFSRCMWFLWGVWGPALALFLIVFFLQSALDKFGPRTSTAGMWFASLILPAITLLAGQFGYTKKHHSSADTVDGSLLTLSVVVSVLHVVFMVLVLYMQPSSGQSPIQFLERMQPFLLFTGSLLTTFLGALFVSQRPGTQVSASPTSIGAAA